MNSNLIFVYRANEILRGLQCVHKIVFLWLCCKHVLFELVCSVVVVVFCERQANFAVGVVVHHD